MVSSSLESIVDSTEWNDGSCFLKPPFLLEAMQNESLLKVMQGVFIGWFSRKSIGCFPATNEE